VRQAYSVLKVQLWEQSGPRMLDYVGSRYSKDDIFDRDMIKYRQKTCRLWWNVGAA